MNNDLKVAIVTDSTADLPENLIEQHNIHVVPNIIIIDGHSYEDGVDITRQEFYELLPNLETLPTTSTASLGVYQNLYERLLNQGYHDIISLHVSSKLSGIFNTALLAAQNFCNRVHVVDSQQVSLGLGFQVLVASEEVANQRTIDNIVAKIKNLRSRTRVVAMLDTLEYVHRGGRVSWARARLGELLRIKPLVEVKGGDVISLGVVRTYKNGVARLKEILISLGSLERVAILHSNAEDKAHELLSDIASNIFADPLVVNVNTVIGVHVGPDGLGFAAIVKDIK